MDIMKGYFFTEELSYSNGVANQFLHVSYGFCINKVIVIIFFVAFVRVRAC